MAVMVSKTLTIKHPISFSEAKLKFKDMPLQETIERIAKLNRGIERFWSGADGWAPIESAQLLTKSRLDRQVSLSVALKLWVKPISKGASDGELILAWANLGALVEGTLKLFLSVYLKIYINDVKGQKRAKAIKAFEKQGKSPEGLTIQPLRLYCVQKKIIDAECNAYISKVQERRNAIHAFKDKVLGDSSELELSIKEYLIFLRALSTRLPYPSPEYEPREV